MISDGPIHGPNHISTTSRPIFFLLNHSLSFTPKPKSWNIPQAWYSPQKHPAEVILSAFALFKHTSISINELFPVLDNPLQSNPCVAFSAEINLFQPSATFITMGKDRAFSVEVKCMTESIQIPILQLKWAKYGVAGDYDKILLAWYWLNSFTFGLAYFLKGWYLQLISTWGIPSLFVLNQL